MTARTDEEIAVPDPPDPSSKRLYLRQFDLFRVIAFVGVVAQHSVLWPVPGGSEVGWSFVMFLHATRNVFFFLAALVAVYSQLSRPLSVGAQWLRRIRSVVIPYLAWTAIYWVYTLISTHGAGVWSTLGRDLYNGYYQLYFLVVLFQLYFLLPGILWLIRKSRGHHGWVLVLSLLFQLAMSTLSHYFAFPYGDWHAVRSIDTTLLTSRLIMGYQLYIVAGALAADHLGAMQRFMERYSTRVIWAMAAMFVIVEGYYAFGLAQGNTPGHASDLYQPVAVVWFLVACYGLWAIGCKWARRAANRRATRFDRIVTWGSDASGGYYLSHVLVLQLIVLLLAHVGFWGHSEWGYDSMVIFVGTLIGAGLLVRALWHMPGPLRTILTGPNRSWQRARFLTYPLAVGGDNYRAPASLSEPLGGPEGPGPVGTSETGGEHAED